MPGGAPIFTLPPDDALAALGSRATGLTAAEAAERLAAAGPNQLVAAERISPWRLLLAQLQNVLIVVLLVATALSAALGHGLEAIVITVIVVFAVLLGFVQEYRAGKAIEALRRMAAPAATVVRDGEEGKVPAVEVVPGDVLVLRAGDRVAADARVIEAANLQVEEAPLTGESVPVEKRAEAAVDPALPVAERAGMVHGGTSVTFGRGRAVVAATGMGTEFGRIARMLEAVEVGKTPLQQNLDRVGKQLARAALAIVAVVVALGLWRGQPLLDMLVFGIALAVAVVPEALPAVVTISLALGVQRMVKRNALMRQLPAVETLGGTTVICSDKTGTLTRDQMTARRVVIGGRTWEVEGVGYDPAGHFSVGGEKVAVDAALQRLLTAAVLVNDAELGRDDTTGRWEMKGDPTEGALVVLGHKGGVVKGAAEAAAPRVDEVPFSSETRRMTTFHAEAGRGKVARVKGAPEVILAAADRVLGADGVERPLDDAGRAALLASAHAMAGDALRVLAIAEQPDASRDTVHAGLTLLGLVGMIDPPRPEAADAIRTCRDAGIRVVMITGDHPVTARAVARELGLGRGGAVMTGVELDQVDDAGLDAMIEGIDVFARVSPAHKLRVVDALQRRGHVVAMTGDGVNDAPALRKADIGVAMGISGTDVSREAAAMTLTDDNFASIVAAVEEGRGIYDNIRKFLMYLLSSNIGEIGLMAGTAVLGLPLPLTAVQILYVNLATDGLPALALALDPSEPSIMTRPPRNARAGIFSRPVVVLMLLGGAWSTLTTLSLYGYARMSGRPEDEASTITFVALVVIQLFQAFNYRSDRVTVFRRPLANRWLVGAVAWEIAMLVALVYVPILHRAFGTFALTPTDWALVIGASLTMVPVLELGKLGVRRGWFGAAD